MEVTTHQVVPVVEASQQSAARLSARAVAERAGLNETDAYRTGIVASELASNLVKHARGGEILMRPLDNGAGVELIALDRGPGIPNVSAAMSDGHSTAGSSGTGLGAVQRLSDEFDIHSLVPNGTIVLARVSRNRRPIPNATPFVIAGVSVARAGEPVCGDAWTVRHHAAGTMVLVADGLGHGHLAAEAAAAAVGAFRERSYPGCAATLEALHAALRHTRGAAAAVVEMDRPAGVVRFAGVGNVCATVVCNGSSRAAVSLNGTLGHQARQFREYSYPWPREAVIVMHSDGLVTHWSLDPYPGVLRRHPAILATVLYRDFNRGRDDVTIVVGREAA